MKFNAIKDELLIGAIEDNYSGFDPFDGLNSKFFNKFFKTNGFIGLAWIQFFKKSPINLRTIFSVPKKRNPKGIAIFILGLISDFQRTGNEFYLKEAISLADWLLNNVSDRGIWGGACWGYHFDWNARAFFVPRGKPNVITSVYVARALYDLGEICGNGAYVNASFEVADFIYKKLLTKNAAGEYYIAYIPDEFAFVHNASLWGSAWLAFVGKKIGNENYLRVAFDVAKISLTSQSPDGSWMYGTMPHHQFIDGFHTGYNLEALYIIRSCYDTDFFDSAIASGYRYYKDNFIENDGAIKYYANNRFPRDMHCVAQAILTLTIVGEGSDNLLVEKIINKAIESMYIKSRRRFYYQKGKYTSNSIDYMRWTRAWVYYSFSFFEKRIENVEAN